jgi:hypothetical protein
MSQLPTKQESGPKALLATVLGSPACNALLKVSLGTVMTSTGLRQHLQRNLSEVEREAAHNIVTAIKSYLLPADPILAQQQRLELIGLMLMTYPTGDSSEEATVARGASYLESLDDIPPWALTHAIRQWNRGDAGNQNYDFMPAPAVLRKLALSHMAMPQFVVEKLQKVLDAAPSLEAALRHESKPTSQGADSEPFKPLFMKPK